MPAGPTVVNHQPIPDYQPTMHDLSQSAQRATELLQNELPELAQQFVDFVIDTELMPDSSSETDLRRKALTIYAHVAEGLHPSRLDKNRATAQYANWFRDHLPKRKPIEGLPDGTPKPPTNSR